MIATRLKIEDVILLEPKPIWDARGFFYESYNKNVFEELVGDSVDFMQDNQSMSFFGVLRGLHYQREPKAQGKLIRVTRGEIFDVAVDIRKDSATYGQWVSAVLSEENRRQLWIPKGFAHGFLALSERVECIYKTTDYYSREHEGCLKWDDESVKIDWPTGIKILLSEKDKKGISLNEINVF